MLKPQIFFTEISEVSEPKINDLLKLDYRERQSQLTKFRFDIDRKLSLYAELLVRYQICKELGITNKEIIFTRNIHGKPYLRGYPEFQFNISHTRNAIAVAFTNDETGIDVERIKPVDLKIAERFFTASELDYILTNTDRESAFYEIWTKNEAYIKCIGTGLSTSLKSFNVLSEQIKFISQAFKVGSYIVSACCEEFTFTKPTVITLTEDELERLFNKLFKY